MSHIQLATAIEYLAQSARNNLNIYEFGVYDGGSIKAVKKYCACYGLTIGGYWGFDSFAGLPDEASDVALWDEWTRGLFDLRAIMELSPKDIALKLERELGVGIPLHLVAGFFEDSLKNEIVTQHNMQPADLIYMDADLYISTIHAYDFLIRNHLLKVGTIVAYDEWNSKTMTPNSGGEELAHNDICQLYGIRMAEIWSDYLGNSHMQQKTFTVVKI